MPRFVVVTVNNYHESDPVIWRDGERPVFYHGCEFDASPDTALEMMQYLRQLGRSTVKLTSDTIEASGLGFNFATIDSIFGRELHEQLCIPVDIDNLSVYVTPKRGGDFRTGDLFVLGELILAEVDESGVLTERNRVTLRNLGGDDRHAVEVILQEAEAEHARIKK